MPLNIKPEYKILVVKNIICANVNTLVFFVDQGYFATLLS